MYVNIDDVASVKPDVPQFIKSDVSMKSIKNEVTALVTCHAQTKLCGENKSLKAEKGAVPMVQIKKEKLEETGVQEIIEVEDKVKNRDVDPMNESMYSDVVTHMRKLVSSNQGKKCIQVYVSNAFLHKTEDNAVVFAVMINFPDCVWYMHSDFIVSCLDAMEKTTFFQHEDNDVDMS